MFSHYFDFIETRLKLSGLWLYDESSPWKQRYLQICYNTFLLVASFVVYLPTELLYLAYCYDDMDVFLGALRDNGNQVLGFYKALNYYMKRRTIAEVFAILSSDEYTYEDCDDFKPKQIIDKDKNESIVWANVLWYFGNANRLSMMMGSLYVFIFLGQKQYITVNDEEVYVQTHPITILSPFGSGTRSKYLMTLFFTMIPVFFITWMIVTMDALFIILMNCMRAHLKVLQGAFRTIHARCVRRPDDEEKEIVKCIKHLQTLYKVADKLEEIFNVQTMLQSLVSLTEMCFSLYILSQTLDEKLGSEITYMMGTASEPFMYCLFGDRITEASLELPFAVYSGEWLEATPSVKKLILVTMTRAARPIYVTIGKITPLTLNTFLTMIRGAYSFFTFLKQRQSG